MAEEKKGFFRRLADGLTKTRNNIVSGMDAIFSGFSDIDDDFYDEKVYRFHHQLYGLLLMEIDQTPVAPLNPAELFAQIRRSIRPVTGEEAETAIRRLLDRLSEAEELGDRRLNIKSSSFTFGAMDENHGISQKSSHEKSLIIQGVPPNSLHHQAK